MRKTIKNHRDFMMPPDAPRASNDVFTVRACPTRFPGDARYGLVVTKRTFRHAVRRNRAKRLLRVWIRANDAIMSPDMDYIFIARAPILETNHDDGIKIMENAIKKLIMNN
jgi:ribonuclease P protein component